MWFSKSVQVLQPLREGKQPVIQHALVDDAVFILAGHNNFGLNSDEIKQFKQIEEEAIVNDRLGDIGSVI